MLKINKIAEKIISKYAREVTLYRWRNLFTLGVVYSFRSDLAKYGLRASFYPIKKDTIVFLTDNDTRVHSLTCCDKI